MITVVTSIYGEYDKLKEPVKQTVLTRFVLVTDRDTVTDHYDVVVEPRPQLHPRLAAKVAKCRPDLYTNSDIIIWVDGAVEITSPDFTGWMADFLKEGPVAQFRHTDRQSIRKEYQASAGMGKYKDLPMKEQVDHYIQGGYPEEWGLWCTGVIGYRRDVCDRLGDRWLVEQMRWTYQDQLSEAPVLHSLGLRPVTITESIFSGKYFTIHDGAHPDR